MVDADKAPASEEAEVSVLGAMLLEEGARHTALERLEPADFHHEGRRRIFAAFDRLNGRGQDGDVATLADELSSADELEAAGGMEALARLVDAVPTTAGLEAHAERLRELRGLRELQKLARDAARQAAKAGPGEGDSVLERARERIREVERSFASSDNRRLRTAREILEEAEGQIQPPTVADRLAWAGRTTLFAGREKSGKSTLVRWAVSRVSAGLRVWGGPPVGGGATVLYWGQEAPEDVAADLDRLGADLDRVHVRDMRTFGNRLAVLERDLKDCSPDLVVIDTLSTFTDLMDLDPGSAADWEPVMNRIGTLAQTSDAAFVLNHHAKKSDGEYRDSTAIGAGVDAILEMRMAPAEGENVRQVKARARSAVPASDFKYALVEEDGPRLELVDGSLSLEERVQRFVRQHPGCSQRDVRGAVRGREGDVVDTLRELSEDGGPIFCDDSSTPYRYAIREDSRGTGTEPARNRSGTGGTDSGGGGGSEGPPLFCKEEGARNRPAESVGPEEGGQP